MRGYAFRHASPVPCQTTSVLTHHGTISRKIAVAYAQQLTTAQASANGDGKPVLQVQVTRPSLPCEKPLPLANVLEVQRLLYLLEAPEYCMRAFREHGVNGQDLLHMEESDLEDSRFKFPKHVQRKVMRIAHAWRSFQAMTDSPTQGSVTMEQCMAYYNRTITPASTSRLLSAFRALDVNNNGNITFEEFLVGFSLLEAAVDMSRPTPAHEGGSIARDQSTSADSSGTTGTTSSTASSTFSATAIASTGVVGPAAVTSSTGPYPANPLAALLAGRGGREVGSPGSANFGSFTSSLASWLKL